MKSSTKLFILVIITLLYILGSVYFLVLLPQKVNNINSKIITDFKNKIYPQLKNTSVNIKKTFGGWTFSFNDSYNLQKVNVNGIDNFFIKRTFSQFNFYGNLCSKNRKVCFLNIKKRNERYIVYPLYKFNIGVLSTANLEIICRLNDNKCYIYNINSGMSKPLVLGDGGYNNMFYLFKGKFNSIK